jgi:hypothetical protein
MNSAMLTLWASWLEGIDPEDTWKLQNPRLHSTRLEDNYGVSAPVFYI